MLRHAGMCRNFGFGFFFFFFGKKSLNMHFFYEKIPKYGPDFQIFRMRSPRNFENFVVFGYLFSENP